MASTEQKENLTHLTNILNYQQQTPTSPSTPEKLNITSPTLRSMRSFSLSFEREIFESFKEQETHATYNEMKSIQHLLVMVGFMTIMVVQQSCS